MKLYETIGYHFF